MEKTHIYGGFLGGFVIGFLGGGDTLLQALIIFVLLDFVTGFMNAVVQGNIRKDISFKGIFKKLVLFIAVGFAHAVDTLMMEDGEGYFRMITIVLILYSEGISILKNLEKLGVPLPEKLVKMFESKGEKQ